MALTSTRRAPWYVIPSNHKWFRNLAVSQIIAETMDEMGLKAAPDACGHRGYSPQIPRRGTQGEGWEASDKGRKEGRVAVKPNAGLVFCFAARLSDRMAAASWKGGRGPLFDVA